MGVGECVEGEVVSLFVFLFVDFDVNDENVQVWMIQWWQRPVLVAGGWRVRASVFVAGAFRERACSFFVGQRASSYNLEVLKI